MAVSFDELKQILRQQREQFEKCQLNLITALTKEFQIQIVAQNSANSTKNSSVDFLVNFISLFNVRSF